ncbi:Transposable element P transposase [Oopsacas minuta]|uniref:Transposable element P transposase n=1 Tax=Oopsacas minuta TaxID=111878 RepID=A0AAV7JHX7_9METZ|nr:Transposable element P transposase [Oopsacas minuta]
MNVENFTPKARKLTAQTFTSFRHSCIVLEGIVNHLTKNCSFAYVLSSFLQNDPIEHHFGISRMMNAAQYNVTFCQVLQSERLIKISTTLKLFSSSTPGESSISLKEFLKSFSISEESSDNNIVDLDTYNRVFNEEETPIVLDTSLILSLAFIAGYCVHSIFKSAFYSKGGITLFWCKRYGRSEQYLLTVFVKSC